MAVPMALAEIFRRNYIPFMAWDVEYADEFEAWWNGLSEAEQEDIAVAVGLLETYGPALRGPYADVVAGSRHPHMKELRVQHRGRPYRVLLAFDPRRCAILLIGGDKAGQDRWYDIYVPIADRLYDQHLSTLGHE
jgi:hypothetical protein